jgi:dihydroxy-acid dehydratase
MPGVIIAAARHNRPFLMIYGGTMKKGFSRLLNKDINISTVWMDEILSVPIHNMLSDSF